MNDETYETKQVQKIKHELDFLQFQLKLAIDVKKSDEELSKEWGGLFRSAEALTGADCTSGTNRFKKRVEKADSKIEKLTKEIEDKKKELASAEERQKEVLECRRVIKKVTNMDIRKISDAF